MVQSPAHARLRRSLHAHCHSAAEVAWHKIPIQVVEFFLAMLMFPLFDSRTRCNEAHALVQIGASERSAASREGNFEVAAQRGFGQKFHTMAAADCADLCVLSFALGVEEDRTICTVPASRNTNELLIF
jgi:hypothetical protein